MHEASACIPLSCAETRRLAIPSTVTTCFIVSVLSIFAVTVVTVKPYLASADHLLEVCPPGKECRPNVGQAAWTLDEDQPP